MSSAQLPKLMKKLVTPVMAKYGFDLTIKHVGTGTWGYTKTCFDSFDRPRDLTVWFENESIYPFSSLNYIRLRIDIVPSYFYRQVDLKGIIPDSEMDEKVTQKKWEYENEDDVIRILRFILTNMENGGFDLLNNYCHDFADSVPTIEDEKELLYNHNIYLDSFCEQQKIKKIDEEILLSSIVEEIAKIPDKTARNNKKKLKMIASALGHIFVLNGCSWEWNSSNNSTRVAIYKKNENIPSMFKPVPYLAAYPLNIVWGAIQMNNGEKYDLVALVQNKIRCI